MKKEERELKLRARVCATIKRMLARGQFGHELVSERAFTEKHFQAKGITRNIVRQALATLHSQGLIEQFPQKGFKFCRVDANRAIAALKQLNRIEHVFVEGLIGDGRSLGDVLTALKKMGVASRRPHLHNFLERETDFHVSIAEAGTYRTGAHSSMQYRDTMQMFFIGKEHVREAYVTAVLPRCQLLTEALIARDARLATTRLADLILVEIEQVEKAAQNDTATPSE